MNFARYAGQRLASALILLMLLACACFVMLDFVPGSFFDEMRVDPQVSPRSVDALRVAHGLSKSALARFGSWVNAALRGDFGVSFASNRPVLELLLPRLRNTLLLTFPALTLGWIAGLLVGVWSAAMPGCVLDRAANFISAALNMTPELVVGCVALLVAVKTGFFPAGGMFSPRMSHPPLSAVFTDLGRHMLLPVLVLATMAFPPVFAHTRAAVAEALTSPFVRSARAHGISQRVLLLRHVLPAASNALISLWGLSFGGLLSASLVTEALFGWPGVGPLFLDAISARDPYLIIAAILCFAAMLIASNLLADLALHFCDPRLRTAQA